MAKAHRAAEPLRMLLAPVITEGMAMGPVPALGEHARAILKGLGLDGQALATLEGAGVV